MFFAHCSSTINKGSWVVINAQWHLDIHLEGCWIFPDKWVQAQTLNSMHRGKPFLICSVLSYLYKQPGDKHWSPGVPSARCFPHWCQNTTYTDSENWQKQSLLLFRFLNQINNWVILNQTDNEEIFLSTGKVNTASHLLTNDVSMSHIWNWGLFQQMADYYDVDST